MRLFFVGRLILIGSGVRLIGIIFFLSRFVRSVILKWLVFRDNLGLGIKVHIMLAVFIVLILLIVLLLSRVVWGLIFEVVFLILRENIFEDIVMPVLSVSSFVFVHVRIERHFLLCFVSVQFTVKIWFYVLAFIVINEFLQVHQSYTHLHYFGINVLFIFPVFKQLFFHWFVVNLLQRSLILLNLPLYSFVSKFNIKNTC